MPKSLFDDEYNSNPFRAMMRPPDHEIVSMDAHGRIIRTLQEPDTKTAREWRRGNLVIGLPAANKYNHSDEGTICLVIGPHDDLFTKCGCSQCDAMHLHGLAEGKSWIIPVGKNMTGRCEVMIDCFRPLNEKEREEYIAPRKKLWAEFGNWEGKSGALLTVVKMCEIKAPGEFTCHKIKVPAGTRLVLDDDFKLVAAGRETAWQDVSVLDLVVPELKCYFPEHDEVVSVPMSCLEVFKKDGIAAPVLPEDHWERLQTMIRRVLDADANDRVYENLGLGKLCIKGRGVIALLYGPPGTGKTLTCEAVADHTERPLVRVKLGSLQDSDVLREKLVRAFERAKKYRAILLLDEVDVFVRRRGVNPVFDDNTAAFLRVLEYFDGILLMTTNLVHEIDDAIFSRAHLVLGFGAPGEDERRMMWRGFLTSEVREAMVGGENAVQRILHEVEDVKLNGREIKTVVQNAVTVAFAKLVKPGESAETVPVGEGKAKWLRPEYFIDEAKRLVATRDSIAGKRVA